MWLGLNLPALSLQVLAMAQLEVLYFPLQVELLHFVIVLMAEAVFKVLQVLQV